MITREMIRAGFENNIITIRNDCCGCVSLCCKIGDNAFYFIGTEDENLSVQEYWQAYTLDMTIEMIYAIIKDKETAEANGLDEGEYEYYQNCLMVTDFVSDIEKMRDFFDLSKEEFLFSYSYLTESEYILTENKISAMSAEQIAEIKAKCNELPTE